MHLIRRNPTVPFLTLMGLIMVFVLSDVSMKCMSRDFQRNGGVNFGSMNFEDGLKEDG